jgi:voltage-gated potassium channel
MFTYISALLFYDAEMGINSHLKTFGDALWWAWMNVTTVGAEIFPVTTVGKVVCVLLPVVGMMFFPIFTVYVSDYYDKKEGGK